MKKLVVLIGLLLNIGVAVQAARVEQRLFINQGLQQTVSGITFPATSFGLTKQFQAGSAVVEVSSPDTLYLRIINNDAKDHQPQIKGSAQSSPVLKSGDSTDLIISTSKAADIYVLYDKLEMPSGTYMGLSAMICFRKAGFAGNSFFWHLQEHTPSWNDSLNQGYTPDWKAYKPQFFTINGRSFPDLQSDTRAMITGKVGDTIHIAVLNGGLGLHAVHFHGYHCRIIASNTPLLPVNMWKDTFPLDSLDAAVLELVPDKPGEYPIHDHNLIAVTGGNIYPNGMLLKIKINP